MESPNPDVLVIGAGAAGLWAAAAAARRGLAVTLLEKMPRPGTKVLATGGGHCNLTTTLDRRAAAQTFGPEGARFLAPAFKALPPAAARARFEAMGVETTVEEGLDKVWPQSGSARQVRDALVRQAEEAGARLVLNATVRAIQPGPRGWTAVLSHGEAHARCLILATGGQSYARTGSSGDAWPWLRALGLKVVDPLPALVPLVSPAPWVHALSGITVDAEVRVGKRGRRRPLLFTHKGLSGPAAMDLSGTLVRTGAREVRVDLLPDHSWEELRTLLVEAAQRKGAPRVDSLIPLPRRLVEAVCTQAGLPPNPCAQEVGRAARHRLVEGFKALVIPISGTLGFDQAEVTTGGLALEEVEGRTMAVHRAPGLFVAGEALDLDGPVGGLNLQAAWATAELAGLGVCANAPTR